jgi:hypothetical protein
VVSGSPLPKFTLAHRGFPFRASWPEVFLLAPFAVQHWERVAGYIDRGRLDLAIRCEHPQFLLGFLARDAPDLFRVGAMLG